MIKMGFNTLAMLTHGLGIRLAFVHYTLIAPSPRVTFADKPVGIDVEEKTSPISFQEESISFAREAIKFKDK